MVLLLLHMLLMLLVLLELWVMLMVLLMLLVLVSMFCLRLCLLLRRCRGSRRRLWYRRQNVGRGPVLVIVVNKTSSAAGADTKVVIGGAPRISAQARVTVKPLPVDGGLIGVHHIVTIVESPKCLHPSS